MKPTETPDALKLGYRRLLPEVALDRTRLLVNLSDFVVVERR